MDPKRPSASADRNVAEGWTAVLSPRRIGVTGSRRFRSFAVPGWNRDARRSRDIFGRTQVRRVADETAIRTRPQTGRRLAHVNSSSSALASFRSAVSKPSVNQP